MKQRFDLVSNTVSFDPPDPHGDLLSIARRMLMLAQAGRWNCLVAEEVEFFEAYELVAIHEQGQSPSEAEDAAWESVHEKVVEYVLQVRLLLSMRQSALAEELAQEEGTRQAGFELFAGTADSNGEACGLVN